MIQLKSFKISERTKPKKVTKKRKKLVLIFLQKYFFSCHFKLFDNLFLQVKRTSKKWRSKNKTENKVKRHTIIKKHKYERVKNIHWRNKKKLKAIWRKMYISYGCRLNKKKNVA